MHLGRAGGGAWFDLLTGTVLFVVAGATATIGATGGDGLRRASVVFAPETLANGTATQARIYVSVNAPTSSASTSGGGNNSVDGIVVNYLQLEQAAASTPYQKVATAFDMTEAGYPAYGYARLDGADDKLTVTLPAPITGDLMIFGRNGSWIEAGVTLPSGAFDLGPTGTVLTPGVLRALGDLVGVVIIGRTTTATERALALRYFAARGAAGWLNSGAEMLSDGGFASPAQWSAPVAGASISGGSLVFDGATSIASLATIVSPATAPSIIIGASYLVTYTIVTSTTNFVSVGVGGAIGTSRSAAGTYVEVLVATTTASLLILARSAAGIRTGSIDNVSLKLIPPGA